eukprot:CAMPEP_0173420018 /NCGR_PEP_ID=MMETSP1357-20121228/1658_1 /TAXON_ID=77926 /ORGANISM="Hemiselmis rufescens, Strain PCC563" /LENGTH=104 /DNA_ID=CAMNT_0014382761 /DNA_START=152 /DNA_END=463 /DNA_ORIENTATION=-
MGRALECVLILILMFGDRFRGWGAEKVRSQERKLQAVLEGHGDAIWDLCYNSLERRVVTASVDRTVRIWDLLGEKCDVVLECHLEPVMAVQCDALRVVSGDTGG